ncbi:MAG TPA: Hsp20/alpha crystallin family protein [Candidatus Alistipes merdigallinarum]|nr:Hsp20/alpha crystallin family protein [Candidatus Alistipes merdigallinarum]
MMPAKRSQNWLPGIFNDFFGNEWVEKANAASPAINIKESDSEYKVEVAAPGMTKDDFSIKIDADNQLIVSMEKKEEHKDENKKEKYLRREFAYTQFQQIMILPDNVEKDKIEAKVENGVLQIDIPKKQIAVEEKKVKEIAIK